MSTVLEATLERQLQRDADMPHAYFTILVILAGAPERRCRLTALADATFTSQSRMSHAITALEKRGWVRRQRCVDDTRGKLVVLTTNGMKALDAAAPAHVRQVRASVFDKLDKEQVAQWYGICAAILDGLDPERSASQVWPGA